MVIKFHSIKWFIARSCRILCNKKKVCNVSVNWWQINRKCKKKHAILSFPSQFIQLLFNDWFTLNCYCNCVKIAAFSSVYLLVHPFRLFCRKQVVDLIYSTTYKVLKDEDCKIVMASDFWCISLRFIYRRLKCDTNRVQTRKNITLKQYNRLSLYSSFDVFV